MPVQANISGRIIRLMAVSQGLVKYALPGDTSWTATTNTASTTPPLTTGVQVFSAWNAGVLYYVDGTHYVKYTPSTNTVADWTATSGSMPSDSSNYARLIATWRGRTALSGILSDEENVFFSKIDTPTDFNYSPTSQSSDQAFAINHGDLVTALMPFDNDTMYIGGDHTLKMLRGDPGWGGQVDLISDAIGVAWGRAFCKDPYGALYFFGNRPAVYRVVPGQVPQRISQGIDELLKDVDTGQNAISMIWNDNDQGIHVFVTPIASAAPARHWFWEQRANAWWIDKFENDYHNPICCLTYDGNNPEDRATLIGSWDGYVRALERTATDDDSYPITSMVTIGPVLTKNMDEMLLKDLQAELGVDSGDVDYGVHVGRTAETAFATDAVVDGTWIAGRNYLNQVRRSGHAIYVKLNAVGQWSMEKVRALFAAQGKVRRRGY